jgi:hypothetical protein
MTSLPRSISCFLPTKIMHQSNPRVRPFVIDSMFSLFRLLSENNKKSKKSDDSEESDQEETHGERVNYRIQYILAKSSMPQKNWRKITDDVHTRELTNFSVWQQPDEEYFDESDKPVEKFLIKWLHASYLHVSWETEKDLVDMVGTAVKNQIKKFRIREMEGTELFEDLSKGEFFPQPFLRIERILDVDDPDVSMLEVDWKEAEVPPLPTPKEARSTTALIKLAMCGSGSGSNNTVVATAGDEKVNVGKKRALKEGDDVFNEENEEGEENAEEEEKRKKISSSRKKRKISKKAKMNYLHGENNVWLTVKWDGLAYSDVTFESLSDIVARGVDYEQQLRMFYRREQKQEEQMLNTRKDRKSKRTLTLDQTIIGSNASPPKFPGDLSLRDYQWEGVRWMLFNISQNRNCILADEMGLGKVCFCFCLYLSLFSF